MRTALLILTLAFSHVATSQNLVHNKHLQKSKTIHALNHALDLRAVTDSLYYDDEFSGFAGSPGRYGACSFFPQNLLAQQIAKNNSLLAIKILLNPDEIHLIDSSRIIVTSDSSLASIVYEQKFVAQPGWNCIYLNKPLHFPATGGLYIGYEISSNSDNVVMGIDMGPANPNGDWTFEEDNAWYHLASLGELFDVNYIIRALCGPAPTTPLANCTPNLLWAANYLPINTSKTSSTFTITNIGAGTLTCTEISGISEPFSTNLTVGEIHLVAGASLSFTFTFSPIETGNYTQQAVIKTNGGDIKIELAGYGTDCGSTADISNTPYSEGFEQKRYYTLPACWTSLKLTDWGSGWITERAGEELAVKDIMLTLTTPENGGDQIVYCNSTDKTFIGGMTGSDRNTDQWLISPKFKIGQVDSLTFYLLRCSGEMDETKRGQENFEVKISTTNTLPESFTTLLTLTSAELDSLQWKKYKIPLQDYSNKEVILAFREHIKNTDLNGGLLAIDNIQLQMTTSDINQNNVSRLLVYPNPAKTVLNVESDAIINRIEIYSTDGTMVGEACNIASSRYQLNLRGLRHGLYFVKIYGTKTTSIKKIIVD